MRSTAESCALVLAASLLLAPLAMGQARWHDPDQLVPRISARAAVDATGDLWLIGGRRDRVLDLWRLRGTTWQRVAASPALGIAHSLAFDSARGLLVAMLRGDDNVHRLWEFDGTAWQSRAVITGYDPHLLFDPVRQHLLVWSRVLQGSAGSLQRWDGQSLAPLGTAQTIPHGMIGFDSASGRVVAGNFASTHEWNGVTWQQVPAAVPFLSGAQMTTDPWSGRVVTFGTDQVSGVPHAFAWNGLNWGAFAVAAMPARSGPVVTGNPVTQRILLCGGGDPYTHADSFAYDGVSWQQLTPDTAAPVFIFPRMVHDGPASALLFDGGETPAARGPAQTARLQGSNCTLLQPVTAPSARGEFAMAGDGSGQVWLFGGSNSNGPLADFWRWTGTTWQQLPGGPPARWRHGMCYDTRRQRLVLYGGSAGYDTWEYDGTAWQLRIGNFPPHSLRATLAYDARRGRTVLATVGTAATAGLVVVWEWDGSNWFSTNPSNPPTAWSGSMQLVYDSDRQRVLLVVPDTALFGHAYEWDGTAWSALGPESRLTDLAPAVASIPGLGVVMQLGTARFASTLRSDRPATVASFGTGCAPLPMQLSSSHPWLGDTWLLNAAPVYAAATCLFATGFSNAQAGAVPLPFDLGQVGWPGCSVLVSPELVLASPWNNGGAVLATPLPAVPAFAGMRLYSQAFVIEQSRFQASNGLELVLGSR